MTLGKVSAYRHSGEFSVFWLLLLLSVVGVSGIPLGLAYAHLTRWIPFIYVNVFVAAGYAFGMGWIAAWCLRVARVRSVPVAVAGGAIAGLFAEYWNWSGHVHALVEGAPWISGPSVVAALMRALLASGSWTIGGTETAVAGLPLALVWFVEGALIVGLAVQTARDRIAKTPFCETSGRWLDEEELIETLKFVDDPAQIAALRSGDLSSLNAPEPRATAERPVYARLVLRHGAGSGAIFTLSVENVALERDKHGEPKVVRTLIAGPFEMPVDALPSVRRLAELVPADETGAREETK